MVVVVAHGEEPGEAGEAGRAVHGAPRGLELRVRCGGDAVIVDVVPGGEDEVAGVQLAPPRHGPRHLQLVVTIRHWLGAPVSDSNETYLVLSFQIPDSFCLILKPCRQCFCKCMLFFLSISKSDEKEKNEKHDLNTQRIKIHSVIISTYFVVFLSRYLRYLVL